MDAHKAWSRGARGAVGVGSNRQVCLGRFRRPSVVLEGAIPSHASVDLAYSNRSVAVTRSTPSPTARRCSAFVKPRLANRRVARPPWAPRSRLCLPAARPARPRRRLGVTTCTIPAACTGCDQRTLCRSRDVRRATTTSRSHLRFLPARPPSSARASGGTRPRRSCRRKCRGQRTPDPTRRLSPRHGQGGCDSVQRDETRSERTGRSAARSHGRRGSWG